MVSKTCRIKSEGIHHINLDVSSKLSEIRSSLAIVSRMEQKHILLSDSGPYTVNESSLLDDSSPSLVIACTLWVDMTMGIIDMQNRKILSAK